MSGPLTTDERREIDEILRDYPNRRAGCLDALKVVQRHRGWVPDDAIGPLAALLGMSPDELEGVATFYPFIFRRPMGRHVIHVCDSVSCWVMGCEAIGEALRSRLGVDWGGTTADGRFTLLPVSCIGACDHAPAMMVDQEVHGDLTPEALDEILSGYA
jgi:NADH-quinone oxidoreductase subunit E